MQVFRFVLRALLFSCTVCSLFALSDAAGQVVIRERIEVAPGPSAEDTLRQANASHAPSLQATPGWEGFTATTSGRLKVRYILAERYGRPLDGEAQLQVTLHRQSGPEQHRDVVVQHFPEPLRLPAGACPGDWFFYGTGPFSYYAPATPEAVQDGWVFSLGCDTYYGSRYRQCETTNYGSHPVLQVAAWTWNDDPATIRSFLRFDLSPLGSAIELDGATLHLTPHGLSQSELTGSNAFYVHQVAEPWDEHALNWTNQPGVTGHRVWAPGGTGRYAVNVTPIVQNWLAAPETNYGFRLALETEYRYRRHSFASSDNTDLQKRPQLEMDIRHPAGASEGAFNAGLIREGETVTFAYGGLSEEVRPRTEWAGTMEIGGAVYEGRYLMFESGSSCVSGYLKDYGERLVVFAYVEEVVLDHFTVSFDPDPVRHRDLTQVFVQAKDAEGQDIDIDGNTSLDFALVQGEELGELRRSLAQPGGTRIEGVRYGDVKQGKSGASGVLYLANGENPVGWEPPHRRGTILVTKSADASKRGMGTVEVQENYKLEVYTEPDTIRYADSSFVRMQPKSLEGEDVIVPDHTPFDFELLLGQEYGTLVWRNKEVDKLSQVPYGELRGGKVKFVADGLRPDSLERVTIAAQRTEYDHVRGAGEVFVTNCGFRFVRYSQGGSAPWADDDYDHYEIKQEDPEAAPLFYKIRQKGCALTAIAMVMKAAEIDLDPGSLNTWMKENNGYVGVGVDWTSIMAYPGNDRVKFLKSVGDGIRKKNGEVISQPIHISKMDVYLNDCNLVVAQVLNPSTNSSHWVVVTRNRGYTYSILDPGYTGRDTLESYRNIVYKFIVYRPEL